MLFAEDAVIGIGLGNPRAQHGLDGTIGDGDRAVVDLVLDAERLAEMLARELACFVGGCVGEGEGLRKVEHAVSFNLVGGLTGWRVICPVLLPHAHIQTGKGAHSFCGFGR